MPPTCILTATHGAVRIVTRLYGEVSDARCLHEQRVISRRAEQLSTVARPVTIVATEE
jgi:hypothetical protein